MFDHVGMDGEHIVYAIAVGRQHLRGEDDVEQQVAGHGQADDIGAAGNLVRSIPRIDALATGVLSASILDEKDEGGWTAGKPERQSAIRRGRRRATAGERSPQTQLRPAGLQPLRARR